MIDLDRLFSSPGSPEGVPNCAQVSGAEKKAGGVASVSSTKYPANSNETKAPQGFGADSHGGGAAQAGHSGHNATSPKSARCAQLEANNHAGFRGLGTVGTLGTVGFQGEEGKLMHGAPVEGAGREGFALHPSAVCLLLAWARKLGASQEERAALVLGLGEMPPGEQVSYWHRVCLEADIASWKVLALEAPMEGMDCTLCKHLVSRCYPEPNSRRRFHWGCALGYMTLETGQGTERIWIAPPECQSWERWQPGAGPVRGPL